jgi:hypothetical protein
MHSAQPAPLGLRDGLMQSPLDFMLPSTKVDYRIYRIRDHARCWWEPRIVRRIEIFEAKRTIGRISVIHQISPV